jgi:hypothetical protein
MVLLLEDDDDEESSFVSLSATAIVTCFDAVPGGGDGSAAVDGNRADETRWTGNGRMGRRRELFKVLLVVVVVIGLFIASVVMESEAAGMVAASFPEFIFVFVFVFGTIVP